MPTRRRDAPTASCYRRRARWSQWPRIGTLYASHLPLCWLQIQRRILLTRTRTAQQVHDVEVVFVAHVLVLLLLGIDLGPRNHRRPRFGPRRRVIDGEFVVDRVGRDARESLGDFVGLRVRSLIHGPIIGSEVRR